MTHLPVPRMMVRSLRALFAAVGIAIVAQTAIAQNTGLMLDYTQGVGDYVGADGHYYYTPAQGTFTAHRGNDNGVDINFWGSEIWDLHFAAAGGIPLPGRPGAPLLTPGVYDGAGQWPSLPLDKPALDVSGTNRANAGSTGTFTVREIIYGPDNSIVSFNATFSQNGGALVGQILFNASEALPPANHFTGQLTAYGTQNQPFSYQLKTSRRENSYAAKNLPPGLVVDPSSGLISGTPTTQGNYQVMLSASEASGTATATLDLTIAPPNQSIGPYTFLDIRSEPGDWIGQGTTRSLTVSDGLFHGSGSLVSVAISYYDPDSPENWSLQFHPPIGTNFAAGTYSNVTANPTYTNGSMVITGNGHGMSTVKGSFEVKEISFDGEGKLQSFRASFVQYADGGPGALRGTICYQSRSAITSDRSVGGRDGQPFSYQIVANNQPVAFTASGLPAGLSLDSQTGLITGVPTQEGVFQVGLVAAGPSTTTSDVLELRINPAGALANISTRLKVGTGNNVLIGGFIITGSDPKTVIVRAMGPSLTPLGVTGALSDPTLELHSQNGATIAANDNWRATQLGGKIAANQNAQIEASGLAPAHEVESAILVKLDPGNYTAIVRGAGDTTGVGLVEVYDLSPVADGRFGNISTRGFVENAEDVMIAGFIIDGSAGSGAKVVVRGLGSSLVYVADRLADPTLELRDSNGAVLAFNNDWNDSQGPEIWASGLAPRLLAESAILTTLPVGNFTAVLRSRDNGIGTGLVEVYNVP